MRSACPTSGVPGAYWVPISVAVWPLSGAPLGGGVAPPALDWLYSSRAARHFSTSYTMLGWLDNSR